MDNAHGNCVVAFRQDLGIANEMQSSKLSLAHDILIDLINLPGVAAHSMIIEICRTCMGGSFAAAPRASRAAWGQTKSGNNKCLLTDDICLSFELGSWREIESRASGGSGNMNTAKNMFNIVNRLRFSVLL